METATDERRRVESLEVIARRYDEAKQAGLRHDEAILFAESSTDIALLRRLVAGGCEPKLIARIVRV